jgi:hypothetical protein
MKEPRDLVEEIEAAAILPEGSAERFAGYSVLGLPFRSGHVLALRRFPASSIGPGYTSVWHRDPAGDWTFYQSTLPQQACSRYFGQLVKENLVQEISVEWTGPRSFIVRSDGERSLEWHVSLNATIVTRLMNGLVRLVPQRWREKPAVLSSMAFAARLGLRTGRLRLIGRAPNGQTFISNPSAIWLVSRSQATIEGEDVGPPGPLPVQAELGEFLVPQRGVFATGNAFLESFDAQRHLAVTSQSEAGLPVASQ